MMAATMAGLAPATQLAPAIMTPSSHDAVLFEALLTPPDALGRRGLLLLAWLFSAASLLTGGLFLVLGAWPVLGFSGGEALLVVGLLGLYRRRALRAREVVTLTEAGLTIRRRDARNRREEIRLDPYWARLRLEPRHGRVSALRLHQRGRAVEIGTLLGEEEKRDLAEALGAALRRYREPVFDNPQLR